MCTNKVFLYVWLWKRIHIHTLHQMVSIQCGMHAEKCLCLRGIPWRLSLRWGMLFLSWDSRVLAWLPERWSSARQCTDFSPLGIWLPWLPAPTDPKQRMRNMLVPVRVSVHVCLCLFISPLSKWLMKHPAYLRALCPCRETNITDKYTTVFFVPFLVLV